MAGGPAVITASVGVAGVTAITSTGGTIAVTDPTGPSTNLEVVPQGTETIVAVKGDPTGATNSTTAFNTAITTVNTAGGGFVYVPFGTYQLTTNTIFVLSNVRLWIAPGTTFFPASNATGPIFTLATASFSESVLYSENCGIIGGPWTVDFSGAPTPGGASGQRGVSVFNARNWYIENGIGNQLDSGSLVHMSENSGGLGPIDGEVRNLRTLNGTNDNYGPIQVTAAEGLIATKLYSTRGVTFRIENDGQFGPVEHVYASDLKALGGHAVAYITAHNLVVSDVRISDFYASGCDTAGINPSTDAGATIRDITIEDGVVDNCPTGVGPLAGQTTIFSYGRNTVRNVTCRNMSGVSFYVMAGWEYDNCLAEDGTSGGFTDATNVVSGPSTVLRKCTARRINATGGQGFSHGTILNILHDGCESYDDSPFQTVGSQILTANQTNFESTLGAGDWAAAGSDTVTRTTAAGTFRTGIAALKSVSGASGDMYTALPTPQATGYPIVAAGTLYVFSCWLKSALESRNAQIQLTYYNGTSTNGTSLSPVWSVDAGGWTQLIYTFTPPAGSNGVLVYVVMKSTAAAGETFYMDDCSLTTSGSVQIQSYGVLAVAPTQFTSIASSYGPCITARVNGSEATHTYLAPTCPLPGAGRTHLSAKAGAGATSPPAGATAFVSEFVQGAEVKVAYYPV